MLACGRQVYMVLLACILPNFIFFLAAWFLGVGRPLVNIDYVVVALVLASGFCRLGVLLMVVFLLVDVLALFGQVVPFVRLSDLLYMLSFSMSASFYHVLLLIVVGFSVFLVAGGFTIRDAV